MSESISINGDPYYTNLVAIDFLNRLGWSRKRKRHWLRRNELLVNRAVVSGLVDADEIEGPDVCWCGVKNPYFAEVHGTCGGTGMIDCHCGGDQCVCHNHGEVECYGCEDCEPTFDDGGEDEGFDNDLDNGDW